jgi:hypothetical protein
MSCHNRLHRLPLPQDLTARTETRIEKGWYHRRLSF